MDAGRLDTEYRRRLRMFASMLVVPRLLVMLMFASMVGCIGACIDAGCGDACIEIGGIHNRSDASCIGVCIDVARSDALMLFALVLWVALMSVVPRRWSR